MPVECGAALWLPVRLAKGATYEPNATLSALCSQLYQPQRCSGSAVVDTAVNTCLDYWNALNVVASKQVIVFITAHGLTQGYQAREFADWGRWTNPLVGFWVGCCVSHKSPHNRVWDFGLPATRDCGARGSWCCCRCLVSGGAVL